MSGWGSSPWGSSPWGGSEILASADPDFGIFCFSDASMFSMLSDPDVSTVGNGGHFVPNAITLDLEIGAGGSFPTDDARVIITKNIPESFTIEWVVTFEELPVNFTDLTNYHIYMAVTDAAGPLVGFFFSKVGLAYSGSVSFPGGNLQLDTTFQVVPGSSDFILENTPTVIRAAADLDLGVVYIYVTALADLPVMGHQLRAIMPVIPASAASSLPTDQAIISLRGTLMQEVKISLDSTCLGAALVIPNIAPVADAGIDQAVRSCSIIRLNASQSYDPEGASLLYAWRLIEAPIGSEFLIECYDGTTHPASPANGFTAKFYSTELGAIDVLDPLTTTPAGGDVLVVNGDAYTIVNKGTDVDGFFIQIGDDIIADSFTGIPFKVLRQRGISGYDTVTTTFFPDKVGFYKFDLIVFDGQLSSFPSITLVNVLESPLPRGCTPDLSFIFTHLSDFWNLVEDKDRITVFWSGLAQVAATELYALWQMEYGKSLRDIQRVFVRRWLHYDLLLPEPLPELSKVHAIFGGITSSFIASSGQMGIFGTTITIHSDVLESDVTLTIASMNPVTADTLATELQNQLQEKVDERFTTHVIERRSDNHFAVRVDAPFPFSITGSCPVFTEGSEDRHPSGTGAGVGGRIYKTDRSLEGLNLQEDDYLILDGIAYRISRVLDDPNDDLPSQRVLVKEDLPTSPSTSWAISGWVTSQLLNFYDGLICNEDHVDFEVSDASIEIAPTQVTHQVVASTVLGISQALPSRAAVDMWPIGAAIASSNLSVFLARVIRRTFAPVHELVVDIPYLQELIDNSDDEAVIRRNVDFFIDSFRGRPALRFVSGRGGGPSIWETSRPPNRLWAEYTYIDNRPMIEANFGIPVGLTLDMLEDLPDTVDYLSAVRGLWYAFFNGPKLHDLRVGTQILLGLPFAEEEGTIEEIRTDFSAKLGRILIRDVENTFIVRSYQFPRVLELEVNPDTGERYKVGDSVARFAPLVEGAEVLDYLKDPRWFEGIMNQGVFYEIEKFEKFVVRIDDTAFSLSTLLFVKNFILKIKPTYTYPLFIVEKRARDAEVSTTDNKTLSVSLLMYESVCNRFGAALMFDQPRASGGGWRNQFDSNDVPPSMMVDDPPIYPTPDIDIVWAFDKEILCPHDTLVFLVCETFAAPFTVKFDSVFAFDTPIIRELEWDNNAPGTIPAGPTGFVMTPVAGATAPATGTITKCRFYALGDPGLSPTNYEIVILKNAAIVFTQPFTDIINYDTAFTMGVAVTVGDAIAVHIRPATGGSRTPNWTSLHARLTFSDAAVWQFDQTIAAGTYCAEISDSV